MLFIVCVASAGCGTTAPSRFYLLDAVNPPASGRAAPIDVTVGIGPVKLPGYLDRPQIVTREAGPEITVAEFDRWAEPLSDNFVRVLGDNLSVLLGTDSIAVFPWGGGRQLDYRVAVDVTRFDGELGGSAVLSARWALSGADGKLLLLSKENLTESVDGAGYEALVTAQSQLVGQLSWKIGAAIESASKQP